MKTSSPPGQIVQPIKGFLVKSTGRTKIRDNTAELCRIYSQRLWTMLMGGLRAEMHSVFEEAITWWCGKKMYNDLGEVI